MKYTPRLLPLTLLLASLSGCDPRPGPGNANDNAAEPTLAVVALGDTGVFADSAAGSAGAGAFFDITDQLPQEEPAFATMSIDAGDISVGTTADSPDPLDSEIVVLVFLGTAGAADPCATNPDFLEFDISVTDGAVSAVTPASRPLNQAAFDEVLSGSFALCVLEAGTVDLSLTIDAIRIRFVLPGEIVAQNCADILALSEVQSAIARLAEDGRTFDLPVGSDVADLQGDYVLEETVAFDPDGANSNQTRNLTVTLADQTGTTIRRSGAGASLTQFIQGDAGTIGLCALERTQDPACDQTIARLEVLSVDTNGTDLRGDFLAVAVRRHAFTNGTCGAAGDFVFGTVSLRGDSSTSTLVRSRGKVRLASAFTPDLLILPPGNGKGTVTDRDSATAVHFETVDSLTTEPIALPVDLTPGGFSALGISADGSRLALVTDAPDRAVTYDNQTLSVVRATAVENTAGDYDYLGGLVDFSPDASRLYVPTTDPRFADRVTILGVDAGATRDVLRRLSTPQGKVPVQVRLSPDGSQMAVLLRADAPPGEARQLVFGNLSTGSFVTPSVDLVDDAGGTVLASQVVYSADGMRVFLAGLGAVVAVEARTPYGITRIDVSGGANDNPVALALSNDGEVLAVAVDDEAGAVNFAVIDTATLGAVNTQKLPGISPRGAIGVAHFGTTRVAMVANVDSTVVAVQTASPFAASSPIAVADAPGSNTLDRIVGGGDVIAVTNIDEPAIYLFDLPPPP